MAGSELPWRPPRVCDVYWSEFRHCKSFLNRFHHYYSHGRSPLCHQWKEDFEACKEWERTHSPQAQETLRKSERSRVSERRNFTPVWDLRKNPPADWHSPLDQNTQES